MIRDIYIQLGDASHHPMQTIKVTSKTNFRRILANARSERWPAKIVTDDGTSLTITKALSVLPARKKNRYEH